MKKQLVSTAILLTTACVWGISFVAQVLGARYLDASTFNAARFLLGAAVLAPTCLLSKQERQDKKKARKTLIAAVLGGSVLFLASFLQQYGTGITANPGKSGFITGIYTVLTPLFYFLFFRRKSGVKIWIGAILAALGLWLLCFDGTAGFAFGYGELLLLLGAVFWAWHIIAVDLFVSHISILKFACGQFLVCGLLNLLTAFLTGNPSWDGIYNGRWAILFCGLLSTGVGFTAQIIGQKLSGNPTRSAILLSTEALFSALGGLLWNALPISQGQQVNASMNVYGILGCCVIFAAIVLSQFPNRQGKICRSFKSRGGKGSSRI